MQVQISDVSIISKNKEILKNSGLFWGASALSLQMCTSEEVSDSIDDIDSNPKYTVKERKNFWKNCPPINSVMSIRTLVYHPIRIKKENKRTSHYCLVPLMKYINFKHEQSLTFEEPIYRQNDNIIIGSMRGKIILRGLPFLVQMPSGILTEQGNR